jgi:hypothetical protein
MLGPKTLVRELEEQGNEWLNVRERYPYRSSGIQEPMHPFECCQLPYGGTLAFSIAGVLRYRKFLCSEFVFSFLKRPKC